MNLLAPIWIVLALVLVAGILLYLERLDPPLQKAHVYPSPCEAQVLQVKYFLQQLINFVPRLLFVNLAPMVLTPWQIWGPRQHRWGMVPYIKPLLVPDLVGVLEFIRDKSLLHFLLNWRPSPQMHFGSSSLGMVFNWKMFKKNSKWGSISKKASHRWTKTARCKYKFKLRWGV